MWSFSAFKEIETLGIVILTIGLVAFSIYNGNAMIKDADIYNHLLVILKQPEGNNKVFDETVKNAVDIYPPKEQSKILLFHIFVSLLAILVIIRKYLPGFIRYFRNKIEG